MTVIGIDSHKDLLAACLVDASGVVIEQRSIANTEAGHAELVGWARAVDAQRVGIEGAGNYGRPAAEALIDAGAAVLEVPPQMTAAARRGRRTYTKTDPVDALEIARFAARDDDLPAPRFAARDDDLPAPRFAARDDDLPAPRFAARDDDLPAPRFAARDDDLPAPRFAARDDDLPAPRFAGAPGELACLVAYRRELVKDRTAAINRLHSSLEKIRCGYHTRTAALTSRAGLDAASRLLRGDTSARAEIARSRIRNIRRLDREVDALTKRLVAALNDTRTSLTSIYGVGPLVAAEILAETGDPARFTTKARFAMANGTAPIEASSGRVVRHRLNRGGNRQLNKAIHIAAIAQISKPDTEGRTYYQRCLDRGKSKREAIRALKRRISDRVWTCLQNDIQTTNPAPKLT